MLTSLCRNLILDLCSCQACTCSAISTLERRYLLLDLLDSSNLLILAKSYIVGRNLTIFFLDCELIYGYYTANSEVSILKLHQVSGFERIMKTLDNSCSILFSKIMLPCHENLINLRLIDVPCVVVLVNECYGVFKELQRRSIDIRIRKCDAGKNEMVAFLDRVVLVWKPKLKSVVLYSFNSKPPSSINLG